MAQYIRYGALFIYRVLGMHKNTKFMYKMIVIQL